MCVLFNPVFLFQYEDLLYVPTYKSSPGLANGNSLIFNLEELPLLTSSLTTYIFPSSFIPFEKNQHSPKQWLSLPKILPSFLWLYYKKLPLIPVVLHFGHDILGLVFQHTINDAD